ncbi:MAG: trypsin-like peptidase domain-containing protein [Bryobacterales bacterium]|nr:trypsin-like peptidase domain-containing protein [Bryobacterales bacterium]
MYALCCTLLLTAACAFAQTSLKQFSVSLEGLAQRVRPSVAQINVVGYSLPSEDDSSGGNEVISRQRSTGTGVILSSDGYIVTNAHVVRGARRIRVKLLPSGPRALSSIHDAKLIGADAETDLAVIKIDQQGLPFLTLGDSLLVKQGQLVLAFGNPLGLEGSVSMGIISSTSRQLKPDDFMIYLQTDAPINPGNSGGPLVDTDGRVVGINTFILSQSGGSEGLGFAIPAETVQSVYRQIRKDGHVHRKQIGIVAQSITPVLARGLNLPQPEGVIITDVEPKGPADKAGVQPDDIITAIDGRPIQNARQLEVSVYRRMSGSSVKLQVIRKKQSLTIEVPVVERQDSPERFADMVSLEKNLVPRLGILGIAIDDNIAPMLPELRHQFGIVVAARSGDVPYDGTGLSPGDVIYSLNGTPMTTVKDLNASLGQMKSGAAAVLQVERDGKLIYVALELE